MSAARLVKVYPPWLSDPGPKISKLGKRRKISECKRGGKFGPIGKNLINHVIVYENLVCNRIWAEIQESHLENEKILWLNFLASSFSKSEQNFEICNYRGATKRWLAKTCWISYRGNFREKIWLLSGHAPTQFCFTVFELWKWNSIETAGFFQFSESKIIKYSKDEVVEHEWKLVKLILVRLSRNIFQEKRFIFEIFIF